MFCKKCGRENDGDAAFCEKCGNAFDAAEEAQVAVTEARPLRAATLPNQGGEQDVKIFSITPTLKFVYAGYAAAILAAILLVVLLTLFVPGFLTLIGLGIGVLLLLVPAYFHVKQKLVRYSLTDTTIEVDRGLISRTTQNIPLRRVQDVTVTATFFQRMLGFGDITIDNASEDGDKLALDNIDSPGKHAELILERMRHLDS